MYELLIGLGIPAAAAAVAVIRYLWKKEKCFIILKQKVEELSKSDEGSSDTHDGFETRLKQIEENQIKNEVYLKLLLDNAKISYKD